SCVPAPGPVPGWRRGRRGGTPSVRTAAPVRRRATRAGWRGRGRAAATAPTAAGATAASRAAPAPRRAAGPGRVYSTGRGSRSRPIARQPRGQAVTQPDAVLALQVGDQLRAAAAEHDADDVPVGVAADDFARQVQKVVRAGQAPAGEAAAVARGQERLSPHGAPRGSGGTGRAAGRPW